MVDQLASEAGELLAVMNPDPGKGMTTQEMQLRKIQMFPLTLEGTVPPSSFKN